MPNTAVTPRKINLVLFDLGGTLIYQNSDWDLMITEMDKALVDSLVKAGFRLDTDLFITDHQSQVDAYLQNRRSDFTERTACSLLADLLIDHGYPGLDSADLQMHIDAMFSVSQANYQTEIDAVPMLNELQDKGYRLGMISNASDVKDVYTLLMNSQLESFFENIIVSAGVGVRKPAPRIFQLALDYFDAIPSQVAMVGDTLSADILGANNSGLKSVWITRRADTEENRTLKDIILPDAVITKLSELPGVLDEWNVI
jgi:HAD superfamily hydrolase (TIGR01662 family)